MTSEASLHNMENTTGVDKNFCSFQKNYQENVLQCKQNTASTKSFSQKRRKSKKVSSRLSDKIDTSDRTYSNNLSDACKVQCQMCDKVIILSLLSPHTYYVHNLDLAKYKEIFGDPRDSIIKKTFHECGLCLEVLLLDVREIDSHLKRKNHNMSHKEYTTIFLNNQPNKKSIKINEEPTSDKKAEKEKYEQDGLYNLSKKQLLTLLDHVLQVKSKIQA